MPNAVIKSTLSQLTVPKDSSSNSTYLLRNEKTRVKKNPQCIFFVSLCSLFYLSSKCHYRYKHFMFRNITDTLLHYSEESHYRDVFG